MGLPNDPTRQMIDFTNTPLASVTSWLKKEVSRAKTGERIEFYAANPDYCIGCYAGELFRLGEKTFRHRSWHSWSTLAQLLGCRMLTPRVVDDVTVQIAFQKLNQGKSFHRYGNYGSDDIFGQIDKREEPSFLHYYILALDEVGISNRRKILNLGVNTGDELAIIDDLVPDTKPEMVGVDIDATALMVARDRLPQATFHEYDINRLDGLMLGKFDLVLSIATLQSPEINTKKLVMNLIQNYLTEDGSIIFGFPNSRWIDGELIQGARAPNYSFSEMSLVIKDIYWIKKYLQQHRYRVRIFGTAYIFLIATRINKSN